MELNKENAPLGILKPKVKYDHAGKKLKTKSETKFALKYDNKTYVILSSIKLSLDWFKDNKDWRSNLGDLTLNDPTATRGWVWLNQGSAWQDTGL